MLTELPSIAVRGRYSVTETAKVMGVDRSTIRRWIECGKMRCGYRQCNKRRFVTGEEIQRFFNARLI